MIDLPGAGLTKTSPSTRFSLEEHAATLVATIDALSLDRVALVGHDSGGAVARFVA